MDLEGLETFLCVHRTGSVSAAALKLSRTQSAISRRLAVLEGQVGKHLFDRIGRRLVISEAGQLLLPHAEDVVAALQGARSAAAEMKSGLVAPLRLALVGTLADHRLTGALHTFRTRYPDTNVHLRTATSDEVSALVRSGDVSLGLRYFGGRKDALVTEVVGSEPLVVVSAASHRLAGRRVAFLKELARERWLGFAVQERRTELFARTIVGHFLSRGIDAIDWIPIDSLTAQKRLVEAGLGIALMPRPAVSEELDRGTVRVIRVGDLDAEVQVVSVMRSGATSSASAQAFLAAFKSSCMERRSPRPKV